MILAAGGTVDRCHRVPELGISRGLSVAHVGTANCSEHFEQATKRGDSGAKLLSSVCGLAVGEDGSHLDEGLLELVNGGKPIIDLEIFDAILQTTDLGGKTRR